MPATEKVQLTDAEQTPEDEAEQDRLRERGELPRHIAVIMDGNGRWAKERNKPRVKGHHEGVESVRDITEACAQLGIEVLTLYTFSTENWERPRREVNALMKLLVRTVRKERRRLEENDIRLQAIGDLEDLPSVGRRELREAIASTRPNQRLTLNLALSYSGRWEIARAARRLAEQAERGEIDPANIDESAISDALTTADLPDPDLLIRTGGEMRLSNFLLWQVAYAELYVTERYWPAFRRRRLYEAVAAYQNRDRRFGRLDDS
jgi:undecaprenyl diphosphate synthase